MYCVQEYQMDTPSEIAVFGNFNTVGWSEHQQY